MKLASYKMDDFDIDTDIPDRINGNCKQIQMAINSTQSFHDITNKMEKLTTLNNELKGLYSNSNI